MQRLPRAHVLALGDGVAELGRAALRRHVVPARPAAAHVHEDEPDGAADGGIGAEARAEEPGARVQPDGPRVRAAHDDERRHRMRGRLHAVEIEGGLEHGLDGGHDHREVARARSPP